MTYQSERPLSLQSLVSMFDTFWTARCGMSLMFTHTFIHSLSDCNSFPTISGMHFPTALEDRSMPLFQDMMVSLLSRPSNKTCTLLGKVSFMYSLPVNGLPHLAIHHEMLQLLPLVSFSEVHSVLLVPLMDSSGIKMSYISYLTQNIFTAKCTHGPASPCKWLLVMGPALCRAVQGPWSRHCMHHYISTWFWCRYLK